jgi:hypothetical protein
MAQISCQEVTANALTHKTLQGRMSSLSAVLFVSLKHAGQFTNAKPVCHL